MPELAAIRNLNLKIIFLVHFVLIALSSMGYWSTSAILFYNFVLILLIVWGLYHPQSAEPVQLAIVVNGASIILDILLLIMCYPVINSARERFSAAMCILHLIVRPFSIIMMIKNLGERTGSTDSMSNLFGGAGPQQTAYEDIDRNVPQTSQQASGAYDFTGAQQI